MSTTNAPLGNSDKAMEAWKTFVATGEILEGHVRPEIAASWKRSREAGLSPWSSDFEECNTALLREKQKRFMSSIVAVEPVAYVLRALLNCNVSLMDGENFIFYLITPLLNYPRTIGTFMDESKLGTGIATLVQYERKPVRCDGFENYRVVSQSYSAVSVPYLDRKGCYIGAMNLNSPIEPLPNCALDLCQVGVEMSQHIFLAGDRAETMLASAEFFKPLLLLCDFPVAMLDEEGHLLSVNAAMEPFVPGWEESPYGTVSIEEYLPKGTDLSPMTSGTSSIAAPIPLNFKKRRSKTVRHANLVRSSRVSYGNNPPFMVCVFSDETQDLKPTAKAKFPLRKSEAASAAAAVDYVGRSPQWLEVDAMVNRMAPVKANVLLLGETGTGKEVVANAIYRRSKCEGKFVSINCGALPRDLLSTELFGYEKGAFTGASEDGALGKFEYADGGVLFLDEIGEMPLDMQVSLLRFLQDRTVTRLGSNVPKKVDVRVVAATNQDLQQLVREKRFRANLYYRLSSVEIHLPPLRVREGDVALLIEYFNEEVSQMLGCPLSPFPDKIIQAMDKYSWPGNVRELRNVVERCLIMAGEGAKVTDDNLPPQFWHGNYSASMDSRGFMTFSVPQAYGSQTGYDGSGAYSAQSSAADHDMGGTAGISPAAAGNIPITAPPDAVADAGDSLSKLGKWELAEVLTRNDGDVVSAARELGVSSESLLSYMNQVGLHIHVTVD